MTKAIDYEFERQTELLSNNQKIIQQTLRYIESTNSTESMRDKEDAQDYRYFRDPDLTEINFIYMVKVVINAKSFLIT